MSEVNAGTWAERLYSAQKLHSQVYLHGDRPPTRNQVAAVLHALADHTAIVNMIERADELGADRRDLGPMWVEATGIGRYYQQLGDALETFD